MNIKKISKILIISLILASLGGCGNTNKNSVDYNAPYYSITITSYEKLRNEYLDVDINIPKIVYTGTSTKSNLFVNSLNKQIENDVTNIVKKAKQNAKDDYSKNNIRNRMPFENMPNWSPRASKSNMNRFTNEMPNRPMRSSKSNINKFSNEMPFKERQNMPERPFRSSKSNIGKSKERNPFTNETVSGFTNSDNLIIPELHNKNIIIVETTKKETSEAETTAKSNNRSNRIAPSENGEFGNFGDFRDFKNRGDFPSGFGNGNFEGKRASRSNMKRPDSSEKPNQQEKPSQERPKEQERPSQESLPNKKEKNNITDIENTGEEKEINNIPNFTTFTSNNRTTITCDYIIFCLDNDYISLNISVNTYGKNSETKNLFYNIDLKNEKTLTIKDMLDDKNKEIDENSTFFINSNHAAIIVNDDRTLSAINKNK